MNIAKYIFNRVSFGQISLASFIICAVSGILIIAPYDVNNPVLSISTIMVLNPAGSFIRNLHFWSAQFFLVSTLLHIWDYFGRENKILIKKGIWLRLTIGIIVLFLAMLTGFILKGDADTLQAWRILDSLFLEIPFIGNLLSYAVLGSEGDLQIVYIHHVATFTIFLAIITFEHSRKIWSRSNYMLVVFFVTAIFSVFYTAPLHDGVSTTVKGPWYFVGFQEVLHWLNYPWISLVIAGFFLLVIYIIPFYGTKTSFVGKRSLLIVTVGYILLTISGMFFRGPNWSWIWPWEKGYSNSVLLSFKSSPISFAADFDITQATNSVAIDGKKESCMICHNDVLGLTPSHNPQAIGCFSCHNGNPFSSDKDYAHKGMLTIPGNFADADNSCGSIDCHPSITERKRSNLMSNLSGMISVDRFVFNEQESPDLLTDVHNLGNSAADEHLKNLCVVCHLDNPKIETGPVSEKSRGGGCLACHINYDENATTAWLNHNLNKDDTTYLKYHPSISMSVTNNHCFGCHSRSARISTNYEGWHETTLNPKEIAIDSTFRVVEDSRVFKYIEQDVHHKLGLGCIDCHNSYELMGDGNYYAHQEDQNTISCSDCHFNDNPQTIGSNELDGESAIIASMRFGNIEDRKFLKTKKRNIPIVNTNVVNDTFYFFTKNEGKEFVLSKPAFECNQGSAHNNLSCTACHSSWAPSCIGCHNEYDRDEPGYNMLTQKEQTGSWVEYVGEYNAGIPALGVRKIDNSYEVIPVVPGMVLSIDVSSFSKEIHDSLIFHRLFAPSSPHTTVTKGRDCKSCHNNPVALGYGKGELLFNPETGYWSFDSYYQNNPNDNIPEDAWISFLDDRKGEIVSTRSNVIPIEVEKQKRILTVGSCLTCHDDKSAIIQGTLYNLDSVVNNCTPRCAIPIW